MDCANLPSSWPPAPVGPAALVSEEFQILPAWSLIVSEVHPLWLCQSMFVLPWYQAGDVTITTSTPAATHRQEAQWQGLHAAVLRLQRSMLEIQVNTEGQITPVTRDFWDDLVTLADPHIRAGVGASACWCEEYEDCVQEAWVEVLRKIHLVDPDPMRGSLAGWLRAIARRTASRFLRRRARTSQMQGLPLASGAQVPDPNHVDPAIEFSMWEEMATIAVSVELLRAVEGENAYRLVNEYLTEPSALACLPLRYDLGAGKFWHLWRKTKSFLQKRLAKFEE